MGRRRDNGLGLGLGKPLLGADNAGLHRVTGQTSRHEYGHAVHAAYATAAKGQGFDFALHDVVIFERHIRSGVGFQADRRFDTDSGDCLCIYA